MRHTLRFLLFVTLSVPASYALAANWVEIGRESLSVDTASLRRKDDVVSVWVSQNFKGPVGPGAMSSKLLVKIDCKTHHFMPLEISFYSGANRSGRVVKSEKNESAGWLSIGNDSVGKATRDYVCK